MATQLVRDRVILLEGIVGSTAYGLNHADSDIDRLGVFVAPSIEIAGLHWHNDKESIVSSSPDKTYHEARKFLRLFMGGNPTIVEFLYLENYTVRTVLGADLLAIRDNLINPDRIFASYSGYAKSQLFRYADSFDVRPDRRVKMARHAYRLMEQGTELLLTGKITVKIADTTVYGEINNNSVIENRKLLGEKFAEFMQIKVDSKNFPAEFEPAIADEWLRTLRLLYME